jgi:hypothetical protein
LRFVRQLISAALRTDVARLRRPVIDRLNG